MGLCHLGDIRLSEPESTKQESSANVLSIHGFLITFSSWQSHEEKVSGMFVKGGGHEEEGLIIYHDTLGVTKIRKKSCKQFWRT
jgi:hypothetical protein